MAPQAVLRAVLNLLGLMGQRLTAEDFARASIAIEKLLERPAAVVRAKTEEELLELFRNEEDPHAGECVTYEMVHAAGGNTERSCFWSPLPPSDP